MDSGTEMGSGQEGGTHVARIDFSEMRVVKTVSFARGYKVTVMVRGCRRDRLEGFRPRAGRLEVECRGDTTVARYYADTYSPEAFREAARIVKLLLA